MRQKAAAEIKHQPAAEAATALLTRSAAPGTEREKAGQARAAPYLERIEADEGDIRERIELNRASFIIGRSPEVAQYVEKSEGASRVHAEISRGPAGYILKDLDSRNGTLYQGAPMIPYKEYPLAEGSVFTIVKSCYTFRSA
ncbi:FHA domain protein [compost metagenome]